MYFVARQHGTGNQVVGVAEAQYPGGPYKPAGHQPLVTQVHRVLTLCGYMLHTIAGFELCLPIIVLTNLPRLPAA